MCSPCGTADRAVAVALDTQVLMFNSIEALCEHLIDEGERWAMREMREEEMEGWEGVRDVRDEGETCQIICEM